MKRSCTIFGVTATFLNFNDESILTFSKDKVGPIPERASSEFTSLFTPPRRLLTSKNSDMQRITTVVKWRSINGFPGYWVSNTGLVKKNTELVYPKRRRRINNAYHYVCIRNIESKAFGIKDVHILVWDAFGNKPKKKGWDVHHIDEDIYNNHINNLEYLPHADHMKKHVEMRKVKKSYG